MNPRSVSTKSGEPHFVNNVLPVGRLARAGRLDDPPQRRLPLHWGFHRLLVSVEDMPSDQPLFKHLPPTSKHVVLVRDPKNLFASRIRKAFLLSHIAYPRSMNESMKRAIQLWKQHARHCLANLQPANDTLGIYFDHWLTNAHCRSRVADWLAITPDETVLERTATEGGGSSFMDLQATNPDREEIRSRVLHRDQNLSEAEQALLTEVLDDRDILELRDQLDRAMCSSHPAPSAERTEATSP